MLMTVDECRAYVATSLTDDALLTLLLAAEADITEAAGVEGAQTEYHEATGYPRLVLERPVGVITSVTESSGTAAPLLLAADDYRVDGQILHRLTTGTNPRYWWLGLVRVIHTPPAEFERRARAQVALIRLELSVASGVTSERIGDYAVGYGSSGDTYQVRKADILAPLKPVMVR